MDDMLNGIRAPATDPTPRWSVGGLFIETLARRDFAAMAECFEPDVCLRALLPRGPIETTGRDAVVERFRAWFGGSDELDLVDATVGEAGSRLYLRWRVGLTPVAPPRRRRLVEQHVFATAADLISALDLLCSGFVSQSSWFGNVNREDPWLERP